MVNIGYNIVWLGPTSHPSHLHRTHHAYIAPITHIGLILSLFLAGDPFPQTSDKHRTYIAPTSHQHRTNSHNSHQLPHSQKYHRELHVFPSFSCPIWSFPVTPYRMPYRIDVRRALDILIYMSLSCMKIWQKFIFRYASTVWQLFPFYEA